MGLKKASLILIVGLLINLSLVPNALAGFGISPPLVYNEHLVPGSRFEQEIILSRSDPKEPVEISVEIEAPEIKDWIKIGQGEKFIYPAGQQQFPMTVIVEVPQDAGYGTYYGKMNIKAAPVGAEGQVRVAIGAQVKIQLRVSGEGFSDFKIRSVSVPDIEEGWPLKFVVNLENLGNVKVRPSRVYLEIFDNFYQEKLASGEILEMSWVEPFKVGTSEGVMAVDLKSGQYWVNYEIYKNKDLVLKEKIRLNVHLPGTLIPPPLFEKLKDFLTASPLRLMLFTFLATLILVVLIIGAIFGWKKLKRKKLRS